MRKLLVSILVLLSILTPVVFRASADELDDVTTDLENQEKKLSDLERKKDQLAKDIAGASVSYYQISQELADAEADLSKIEKDLSQKEEELKQWEGDRDFLIRDHYKQTRTSPIEVFLTADNLGASTKQLQYYGENLGILESQITLLGNEISVFKKNKAKAKELHDELASLKSQLASSLAYSRTQYSSTSSQLAQVKSSIKNLTAKQEQLILEKFAATQGSETVGETPPASEPIPATTFSPAWMMATYGYPHRIGMSQYGAKGRAMSAGGSQNYQQILKAYYGVSATKATNIPSKITVSGCNEYNQCWSNFKYGFETYLKHLYEMPASWPTEALKAQAVAARTYALRYALQGKAICPSQSCQVIKKEINSASWRQAVDATEGMVVGGNNPIPTFYHSTAGGYTISKTTWISYWTYRDGIKDFRSASGKFYEEISGAPWFHTGWGSRTGSGYIPWMTTAEFADIFNAILLYNKNNNYSQYLSPIDKGGWSMSKVRSKLTILGITPVTSISAVVTTFTGGNEANTASIYVSGAGGTRTFTGKEFRDMFNLRSRGTLGIWTYRFDVGYCASTGCTVPTFR